MSATSAAPPSSKASGVTDEVALFVVSAKAGDIPKDVAHFGQAFGARRHRARARGRGVRMRCNRAPLSRGPGHRCGRRQHGHRELPAIAGALRSVRQRPRDPRRRLRRHAARRRQGPRLWLAHASHRARAAAGAGARGARPQERGRSDARLPGGRGSGMQGRRSHPAAPLPARFSQHRDLRLDRRGGGGGEAAGTVARGGATRDQHWRHAGGRAAGELRDHDQALPRGPRGGKRRRGGGNRGPRLHRFAQRPRGRSRILPRRGRRLQPRDDRGQARRAVDLPVPRRFHQASSLGIAHAPRHGGDDGAHS